MLASRHASQPGSRRARVDTCGRETEYMRITQSAGACAVLAIAIAACGSASSTTDSPSQLLTQGVQALTALHSEQVTGTFTIDGSNGSILASVLQDGDASGTLNLGDSDSPFVS